MAETKAAQYRAAWKKYQERMADIRRRRMELLAKEAELAAQRKLDKVRSSLGLNEKPV